MRWRSDLRPGVAPGTWLEHCWFKCTKPHDYGELCAFCDQGLGFCTTCGCMEGSLLVYCPGYKLNEATEDAICCGNVYDLVMLREILDRSGVDAFKRARDERHSMRRAKRPPP